MEIEKILPKFEELVKDARTNWTMNCNKRTKKLADIVFAIASPEDRLRVINIEPIAKKKSWLDRIMQREIIPYISLKKFKLPWSEYHMSFCWNDLVLDPSYGKPITIDKYLPGAFDFSHAAGAKVLIVKYQPDGTELEQAIVFDSKGNKIETLKRDNMFYK